ncbi:hypothetical protein IAR55_005100 [Kwoniella newhampshirensis]|uniref:Choline/carnitine acyltransferase domain-containing protein n=1 Tax=Kwoniella newhampshirensis TaxID=1651941 RepID=A0AAW0YJF8_9TREE
MFSLSAHRRDQPKTFSNQSKLPRLPVPELEKSLEGYVKSLVPLLEQAYDPASLPNEIEKRKLYAKDFASPGGLGRALQERLRDLDHVSPNNWLNDTLWLALAYHTWRAPLLINSNWWLLFAPDPSDPQPPTYSKDSISFTTPIPVPPHHPSQDVPSGSQGGGQQWLDAKHGKVDAPIVYEKVTKREWISDWQIRKAAWVARRFSEFRTKLLREEILPDSSRAGPFDMDQYAKMFNLSRIPLPNCDAFSVIDTKALHITLLIDDFVYSVDIFSLGEDGIPEPISVAEVERRFRSAATDAKRRKDGGEIPSQIGILTADERDNWVKVRNSASGIDGGRNRWFDKAINVMLETNGRTGLMGEHSPVDALIPSVATEYVLGEPVDEGQFAGSITAKPTEVQGWERLEWVVDEEIQREIKECKSRNQKLIDDSDASPLWWAEYGAEWIKKVAKQSPDAYIQQILQLAWYKDQGYATATYETASTRMLLHGRTDVIRTLSSDSRDLVKAMQDPTGDDKTRYALLTKACTTHNTLTRDSSAGHGFDRHLMGLKVQLRAGETHALFEDEMYAKSQEWKLSTSGLSAGGKFMGTGFGAAWPDGYGINYLAGPHLIKFGIESKFSCSVTSTQRFKHHIAQALRDMRRVCELAAGNEDIKAKL